MKQNWWKLLVVLILVVAVGVVLAAKNKTSEPETKAASNPKVAVSSDRASKVDVAKTEEPKPAPAADAPLKAPKVVVNKPLAKHTAPQPAKKVVAKKEEPKPKPRPVEVKTEQPVAPKGLPKMLELGADKCIPCKMMKPIIEDLEKNYKGSLDVEFIDVWKTEGVAEEYGIQSIPTQIFFDENGKEFFRHEGFFPKEDILNTFKEHGIKL